MRNNIVPGEPGIFPFPKWWTRLGGRRRRRESQPRPEGTPPPADARHPDPPPAPKTG